MPGMATISAPHTQKKRRNNDNFSRNRLPALRIFHLHRHHGVHRLAIRTLGKEEHAKTR